MALRRLWLPLLAWSSLALAPIAILQGKHLRKHAVRLDEAPGNRCGQITGDSGQLRLLAVGESPFAGVGLDHIRQSVACRLAEQLHQATDQAVDWRILAGGGLTAAALRRKLSSELSTEAVDLIVIALGVNDSLAQRSARCWRENLEILIEELQTRTCQAPVLLAGVPDMRHFPLLPFPLNQLLGNRARLLDHTAGAMARSRSNIVHSPMGLDARSVELFCEDGFHPNAIGHARWAEQLAPAALDLLGRAGKL